MQLGFRRVHPDFGNRTLDRTHLVTAGYVLSSFRNLGSRLGDEDFLCGSLEKHLASAMVE